MAPHRRRRRALHPAPRRRQRHLADFQHRLLGRRRALRIAALLSLWPALAAAPASAELLAGPRVETLRRIAIELPTGAAGGQPIPPLPSEVRLRLDGAEQQVTEVRPAAGGWTTVVFVDLALATPETVRRAAGGLAAESDRLVRLGTVEVVLVDPFPESLTDATRDAEEVREALELVADAAEEAGALIDERRDAAASGAPGSPGEARRDEVQRLVAGQESLLAWLARRDAGGPGCLILVQDGFDLDSGRDADPDADGGPLRRTHDELARVLAALGWTVLAPVAAAPNPAVPGSRAALQALADATGGELLPPEVSLAETLDRLAGRHLVTVRLAGSAAGAPRPLEVRLASGALVRAPRWAAAARPPRASRALARELLEEGVGGGDLPVQALLVPRPGDATRAQLEALLSLQPGLSPASGAVLRVTWLVSGLDAPPTAGHDEVATSDLGGRSAWLYRTPIEAVAERVEAVALIEDLATGRWGATRARPAAAGFGPLDERVAVHDAGGTSMAAEAGAEAAAADDAVIRLLPPRKRPVTGKVRFQTLTSLGNVRRVEFLLDGERVAEDDRAPFAATIDVGETAAPRRIKVVAYTSDGLVLGAHEIEVNSRERAFRVEIARLVPRPATASVEIEARIELPPDGRLDRVEFYRNEALAETRREPPWRVTLAAPDPSPADFVRVVAVLADGTALEDARLLTQAAERVEVNLVELHVMVGDRDGHPVRDLAPEDFAIRLDGAPRPVERFAFADEVPLVLGVVIDTSESMWPLMPDTKQAGVRFLSEVLEPQDRAFLVDFDTKPRLAQALTGDFLHLVRGFNGLTADGFTALFDAVIFSLLQFEEEPGRKALVLLTDGDDYQSRFGPRRCVQYGRQLGVPLYVISLAAVQDPRRGARRLDLETITEGTGGRVFYIRDLAELSVAYDRINDELRSQYVLGFSTDRRLEAHELDAVKVDVARKGAEVRTVVGGQQID